MSNILVVSLVSFMAGFMIKLSDLLDEHGLVWFRGSKILSGVLWGSFFIFLASLDHDLSLYTTSTLLYWVYSVKLDYTNHSLAGVLYILYALATFEYGINDVTLVSGLLLWLIISKQLNKLIKGYFDGDSWFYKFIISRFRFYLGPLVLSILLINPIPFISCIFQMISTELVTIWYVGFREKARKSDYEIIGMKYDLEMDIAD